MGILISSQEPAPHNHSLETGVFMSTYICVLVRHNLCYHTVSWSTRIEDIYTCIHICIIHIHTSQYIQNNRHGAGAEGRVVGYTSEPAGERAGSRAGEWQSEGRAIDRVSGRAAERTRGQAGQWPISRASGELSGWRPVMRAAERAWDLQYLNLQKPHLSDW
jgi:hypothetical protein